MKVFLISCFCFISLGTLHAKYYKCFYANNGKVELSKKIALFIEEDYITVMDELYQINATFIEDSIDEKGTFSLYKKEADNFLYQAKIYKHDFTMILTRKNITDNKILPDTMYKCENPTQEDKKDNPQVFY